MSGNECYVSPTFCLGQSTPICPGYSGKVARWGVQLFWLSWCPVVVPGECFSSGQVDSCGCGLSPSSSPGPTLCLFICRRCIRIDAGSFQPSGLLCRKIVEHPCCASLLSARESWMLLRQSVVPHESRLAPTDRPLLCITLRREWCHVVRHQISEK
jgi:hypothetical protein